MKIIYTLLLAISVNFTYAQDVEEKLNSDQYDVINEVFKNSKIKIFHKTIDTKIWVNSLNTEDVSLLKGPTCDIISDEFYEKIIGIQNAVDNLYVKQIEQCKLGEDILIDANYSGTIKKISEPLIYGNFALIFVEDNSYQVLYILKRLENNTWDSDCRLELYRGPSH